MKSFLNKWVIALLFFLLVSAAPSSHGVTMDELRHDAWLTPEDLVHRF
ncbi:MAG: hypothetical protein JWQ71_3492, partial [Pedosphaera sp.]|nr:hypothetical protein [Pedosphaera sp.]